MTKDFEWTNKSGVLTGDWAGHHLKITTGSVYRGYIDDKLYAMADDFQDCEGILLGFFKFPPTSVGEK